MMLADDKTFVGPPEPPPDKPVVRALPDDPQTLRMRIDHNMKAVEELLRRREIARSRELQDDILADLDKLLLQLQPPQSTNPNTPPAAAGPPPTNDPIPDDRPEPADGQGPSGGSRSSQSAQSNKPQPGGGSAGRPSSPNEQRPGASPQPGVSRRERRNGRSQASNNERTDQAKAAPGNNNSRNQTSANSPGNLRGDANGTPGSNPNQAKGATMSPSDSGPADKLADVARDVWGHLPESLRQEVDHYYRDRFMPRYRELLQHYYNRLSETERRSKDKK